MKTLNNKEKTLNKLESIRINMKKDVKITKLSGKKLVETIKEAQKDPEFIKEVNKFIKATTRIHKLN